MPRSAERFLFDIHILANENRDMDDQRGWQVAIGRVPDLLARVVEERKRREMVDNAKN